MLVVGFVLGGSGASLGGPCVAKMGLVLERSARFQKGCVHHSGPFLWRATEATTILLDLGFVSWWLSGPLGRVFVAKVGACFQNGNVL